MKGVGALATVAIVLGCAASASAADWTVDSGKASAGCSGNTCKTIDEAVGQANTSGDRILLLPGFHAGPTNAITKTLTIRGTGAGPAVVFGTITFDAPGTLQRVLVYSNTTDAPAVRAKAANPARTVTIESSILSGNGAGAGIEAEGALLGTINVQGRHLTIADGGAAPPVNLDNGLGTAGATIHDSILLGTPAGDGTLSQQNNDTDNTTAHRNALFVDAAGEDFHLRLGSPAIDQGEGAETGEIAEDIEGEARGATWDRGADEFVNHPPAAPGLVASKMTVEPGEAVTFGALAGPQPDADRGDGISAYRFSFGDGGTASGGDFRATHAFAAPGRYAVSARTVDLLGAESGPSNAVTITVTLPGGGSGNSGEDKSAPKVSITSPRSGQRVKRGRRAPVLRGRASDASGVRSVEIALKRIEGRRCRWYDTRRRSFVRGSCATPRFFRAKLDDFAWSYTFPRGVNPATGRYELRARATDLKNNRSQAFSASAHTLAGFRIVR
jgi:PKD domain-containing protein